jgi:hypothetical protein
MTYASADQLAKIAMLAVQKLERIAVSLETIAKVLDTIDDRLFEINGNIDAVIANPDDAERDPDDIYYVRVTLGTPTAGIAP